MRRAWVKYHCISPVSFYFVVQILSLSLSSSATDSHFFHRLRPGEVGGRRAGGGLSVGVSMATDLSLARLVAAALFAGG